MSDETGIDAAGFDVAGLDAAERRVDEWEADFVQRTARRAATLVTARNDDGSIAVTMSASGKLLELHLAESTRLQPAAETAREILAILNDAQTTVAARTGSAILGVSAPSFCP
ncbi:YbaB/EbfC family nucleoid-associated protein [Actinoplanes sp. NPDC051494]|uniref:YbaB/EbfC family nucleoid-associated protein n=1 Tax=Actinoplanes sp. NPDC051494 TaxID=3363907 RepID=UPI0037B70BAB